LQLPKGHRLQVVSGTYTKEKFALVIRVDRNLIRGEEDFHDRNRSLNQTIDTITRNIPAGVSCYRKIANLFACGANLLIAGGTGSGKTSFANSILRELYLTYPNLRIVTIEGVSELKIQHPNNCSLLYSENNSAVGKAQVGDLLDASLRMRPDRLIIGELRGSNVSIFREIIDSGHSGTLATVHASTPSGAINAIANKGSRTKMIESSAEEGFKRELYDHIDGVVMVKKENGLTVIEYIPTKDIPNYTETDNVDKGDHDNDNDYNNNIDLIGVGNAEICA
jgi:type IV secretory pathway ATPase VirB11/archaellum biosynthesis ATPase